jgi:hypothetical protein
MVMPVMTKLYKTTGDPLYLHKLYEYFSYAKQLMYDEGAGLFYRDAKYVYPQHKTVSGKKDFWSRGNGWVFASLAKVLQDLPATDAHREEYLPKELPEGQVRNALTSVMKRMFSQEGNFNEKGFLQLGFAGHQPDLADWYTNNGSMYLTSEVFLPLGLPATHSFWTVPPRDWTGKKAWNGKSFPKDHAIR